MDKKSYEELEAENKSLRHVMSTWRKTTAQELIAELEDKNKKLRLELHTLRFKESQEQRFIWWTRNVYSRYVMDTITEIYAACTYQDVASAEAGEYELPINCFNMMERLIEYSHGIYDGTYLDNEISMGVNNPNYDNRDYVKTPEDSNEPSESEVSTTQDVLMDIKKDDICPDCAGSGEVGGNYGSEDGMTTCDRCNGKGTI